eukprot:Tbor_TRINITY_DN2107_c0_g2::TRINITY_DN2107_c0_g2_i1::g.5488::m.5488/K08857/NEK1_4_5; NIMA (never in mitosis gene a)-related kinase 1/4/5
MSGPKIPVVLETPIKHHNIMVPHTPKEAVTSSRIDPLGEILGVSSTCRYQKIKLLGQGSFGSAWRVTERPSGRTRAAKVMDINNMTAKDRGFVTNEVKCLGRCSHPNIIGHVGNHEIDGMLLIIMEFADGGDLYKQIKARQHQMRYFREHEILFIFLQLCLALDHIHVKKMMHRDIKTSNVLLTTAGLVKLGDFGFSRQYEDSLSNPVGSTFCGTPYYLSPELWRRAPYSKKTEMWGLGVVLYEVMSLKRPFGGKNMDELIENIIHGRRLPLPPQYSTDLCGIVQKLLNTEPSQRPSIRALLQEPFIRNGLLTLRRTVENHKKIPYDIRLSITKNVDDLLSSDLTEYESRVNSKVGILMRHTADEGWQECEISLTVNGISLKDTRTQCIETIDLASLTSVCPIDSSISNANFVLAMKNQAGKAFWLKDNSQDNFREWLDALQNAMPY